MPEEFVILCCENIRPEVDAVLASGVMPQASARSFPFHCGHVRSAWETVKDQYQELERANRTVCLLGCGCANTFDIPREVLNSPLLNLVESGAPLFLPEALVKDLWRRGAYLILPGWLLRWKQNAERDGLDRSTAREMFRELLSEIILLDTGVYDDLAPVLTEFTDFTGLPSRTFPVGLDHFRARLAERYLKWERDRKMGETGALVRAAEKRVADYSMIADLTGRLIGMHDEKRVILEMLEMVSLISSPKQAGFLPYRNGVAGEVVSVPEQVYPDTAHFHQTFDADRPYRIAEPGDGFLFQVMYNEDIIGVLSVDRVALPENLDEYINLTHFICRIGGLSVAIARARQDLVKTIAERDAEIEDRKRIQADLFLHSEILLNMAEGVALIRIEDGTIVFTNKRFNEIFGYNPGELPGKKVASLNAPDARSPEEIAEGITKDLERAGAWTGEIKNLKKDGTVFWCRASVSTYDHPLFGRVWITVHEDITDQRKIAEAFRESEERYRKLFEQGNDAIFIADAETKKLTDCNRKAEILTGYTRQEIAEMPVERLHPADQRSKILDKFRAFLEYLTDSIEMEILTRDGRRVPVSVNATPVTVKGRTVLIGIFRDISWQKEVQETLRQKSEELDQYFSSGLDLFCIADMQGCYRRVNIAWTEILGYQPGELEGKPFLLYVHPDDLAATMDATATLAANTRVTNFTNRIRHRDGTYRWIEWRAFLKGERIYGAARDITERKHIEEALRESEEQFRAIFHNQQTGLFLVDPETHRIVDVNQNALDLIGADRGDVIGKVCHLFVCPAEIGNCPVTDLHKTVDRSERVLLTRDGRSIQILKSVNRVVIHDRTYLLESFIDISERKRMEEALRESEERYRTVIENIQDAFFRINAQNIIEMVSPSAVPMFGRASAEEMTGKPVTMLWKTPEQRQDFLDAMRAQGGSVQDFESEFVRADGSAFWVSISARLRTDPKGNYAGTEGIIRDISERKKIEDALKGAIKKLNMLSSITRHDILNQIMGLRTYLELSKEDLKGTRFEAFIEKEDQAAESIQRQIEFTKYYQDIGVVAPKWQDAAAVIHAAAAQLNPQGTAVEVAVEGFEIFADPLIIKVFFNLMENSLRHGEKVTSMSFSSHVSDDHLILLYQDNGIGITEEDKKKLFQKGFGKHTGLGLFLSREILAITGITIVENGKPGHGVRFEITVPAGGFRPVTAANLPVSS